MTSRPFGRSCSRSSLGNFSAEAETRIRSNFCPGAPSEFPACRISTRYSGYFLRLFFPKTTSSGTTSTPMTSPLFPTILPSSAVVHPDHDPISSTLSHLIGSRSSSMKRTVDGWEIVCPYQMGNGRSREAKFRYEFGMKSTRFT